jgi:hypothetical protein
MISGARPPKMVYLTNWWDYPPFREVRVARAPANWRPPTRMADRGTARVLPPPPPPARVRAKEGAEQPVVTWRGVPGQRRLHPPPPRV